MPAPTDPPRPPPAVAGVRPLLAAVGLVVALVIAACGSSSAGTGPWQGADADSDTTTAAEPVVKDVLATKEDPPGAPGYTLTLIRYTIAPGAQLAPHVHPGVQMAEVDEGDLTYTVVSGTAELRRGGGEPTPVTGPTTITLHPGDSIVEPFDMVHYGANETDEPVVLSATLLTETDQGLSVARLHHHDHDERLVTGGASPRGAQPVER